MQWHSDLTQTKMFIIATAWSLMAGWGIFVWRRWKKRWPPQDKNGYYIYDGVEVVSDKHPGVIGKLYICKNGSGYELVYFDDNGVISRDDGTVVTATHLTVKQFSKRQFRKSSWSVESWWDKSERLLNKCNSKVERNAARMKAAIKIGQ